MKQILMIVLMALPLWLAGQDTEPDSRPQAVFGLNGNAGYITLGSETFSQVRLLPEIAFGKFSLGLDIDLLINSDMNIRREDWNDPTDIISKIYFIRYAQREDPFYLQVDGFTDYTLNHGLIMNHYDNRLLYPLQKHVGAMLGGNIKMPMNFGVEAFSANLAKNDILAAMAHLTPFAGADNKFLSNLSLGATIVTDRNQYDKYDDKDHDRIPDILDPDPNHKNYLYDFDGDGYYNSETANAAGQYTTTDPDIDGDGILDSPRVNSFVDDNYSFPDSIQALLDNRINPLHKYGSNNDISVYGLNYDLPLVQNAGFSLSNYGEFAQINGYGNGWIWPGFESRFLVFDVNLELRRFSDEFEPAYFDNLYDEQRSFVVNDTILGVKEQTLHLYKQAFGWYGRIQAEIGKTIFVSGSYQDMYGEQTRTGKSFTLQAGIDPRFIPKLREASLCYSQYNVKSIDLNHLQTPTAAIDGQASYLISNRSALTARYTERYVDLNADGKIKGMDEIIKGFTLIVEFKL